MQEQISYLIPNRKESIAKLLKLFGFGLMILSLLLIIKPQENHFKDKNQKLISNIQIYSMDDNFNQIQNLQQHLFIQIDQKQYLNLQWQKDFVTYNTASHHLFTLIDHKTRQFSLKTTDQQLIFQKKLQQNRQQQISIRNLKKYGCSDEQDCIEKCKINGVYNQIMDNCSLKLFIEEICLVLKQDNITFQYIDGCYKNSENVRYSINKIKYIKLTVRVQNDPMIKAFQLSDDYQPYEIHLTDLEYISKYCLFAGGVIILSIRLLQLLQNQNSDNNEYIDNYTFSNPIVHEEQIKQLYQLELSEQQNYNQQILKSEQMDEDILKDLEQAYKRVRKIQ